MDRKIGPTNVGFIPKMSNINRRFAHLIASAIAATALCAGVLTAGASGSASASAAAKRHDTIGSSLVVNTDKGKVKGFLTGTNNSLVSFEGIPYAAPPVGSLRLAAPQPHAAWSNTLDAYQPGSECLQSTRGPGGTIAGSEDCLYLNVTVPNNNKPNKPVLVMLYGGGFQGGQGAEYNDQLLANADNVILVTPNYRLGILGWLASSALDNGKGASGDYGIEDDQAALRWVQKNIAGFGGNPHNVTLGGLSAGAMMTCLNLAAPGSRGLFQRAIVESGPCAFNWETIQTKEAAEASIPAMLCALEGVPAPTTNAAETSCLRAATTNEIMTVQNEVKLGADDTSPPSVGGSVVPNEPRTALGKIPLLTGGVVAELAFGGPTTEPAASYLSDLTKFYGAPYAQAIADNYPLNGTYLAGVSALQRAESDFGGTNGGGELGACYEVRSDQIDKAAGGTLYAWQFGDIAAGNIAHTSQEQYLFPLWNNNVPANGAPLSGASVGLSRIMVKYWGNFIATGNPNGNGLPHWPKYSTPTSIMELQPGAVGPGANVSQQHNCGFWWSAGLSE